jgi:D-tyrosyl-tRNA(Tyr) deacylase
MKTIVQRVTRGQVVVGGQVVGAIGRGAVLLVGVEAGDTLADAHATATKIAKMRIFPGATPTDHSLVDVGGACLVISQFTLAANLRKGNRPSFTRAMDPEPADAIYRAVVAGLAEFGIETATGEFGAEMQVELVNDGPLTFIVHSVDGRIQ